MKKILLGLFGAMLFTISAAQKVPEFHMKIDSIWMYNCSIENIDASVYRGKIIPKDYILIMTKWGKYEILVFKEESKKDTLYYVNSDNGITKYGDVYINILVWKTKNLSTPPSFKGNFLFTEGKEVLVLETVNKDFTVLYFLNKTKYKRK